MTRIEKLEVKIADYKKELEQLEDEIKFLKLSEEKKKSDEEYSRVGKDETYYSVAILGKGKPHIVERQDKHKDKPDFATDDAYSFKYNNYFKSEKEADKMVNVIKFLFKLQRLHDIFCPDYKPDWVTHKGNKYYVIYDTKNKEYVWAVMDPFHYYFAIPNTVYFPNLETVKKVCAKLNEELKENE